MSTFHRIGRTPAPVALFTALAFGLLISDSAVASQVPRGPLDLTGDLHGAPFEISVPPNWNRKLLVFAPGYRDVADHPGEVEDRVPHPSPSLEFGTALYHEGWALAGTAYQHNGYAVKEALHDLPALARHFAHAVGKPSRTLLHGASLGSIPTLALAERSRSPFDGFLAACALGAGAPRLVDHLGVDTRLAYDVAFGMPASWGTPGDVRDDLDFESEVLPVLADNVADPLAFAKFEFIRLVTGVPGRGLQAPPGFYPDWLGDLFLSTEAGGELERRAGGPVSQNVGRHYTLTTDEQAALAALGLDADPLLRAMNARTNFSAPAASRNYVKRYAEYSGNLKRPVLTLHTIVDGHSVSHEAAYRDTVAAAGRTPLLAQAYSGNIGHCNFDTAQSLAAVHALDTWADTGRAPTDTAFPALLGFVHNFKPPPWPQP
jgi:hypothetical protein